LLDLNVPQNLAMAPRVDNLRESSHRVVRTVALGHLADAASARDRMSNGTDDEALHDFRVALRRLRSWERAFRPFMKRDLSPKLRRRLRNLARDTGASRDLEVHLAWLREQRRGVGRRQRPGLTWLLAALTEKKEDADAVLAADVDGRFTRLHNRLSESLASYRESLRVRENGRVAPPAAFADALAPRVRDAAALLLAHLERITSAKDDDECHEARIAAKRLRYLLEPITRLVPGAEDAVERLKTLQDVLGDLHDAQVFGAEVERIADDLAPPPTPADADDATGVDEPSSTTAAVSGLETPESGAPTETTPAPAGPQPNDSNAPPASVAGANAGAPAASLAEQPSADVGQPAADLMPGIALIADRLRGRAAAAFTRFADEWLGDRSVGFFKDIDAVADRIEEGARIGVEIERKYLLSYVPDEARVGRRVDIDQGYIPGARLHERIRRVTVRRAGKLHVLYYRTIKLGEGIARTEIEEETTAAIFEAMWPLTRGHRLRKRRYAVDVDGYTWEIDEFKNRDLVLAEIELDSEDDEVKIPEWLDDALQREVTLEPAFQNINLAR
jgi:CHAD domain-containing protein/CYTH domain-containing protein